MFGKPKEPEPTPSPYLGYGFVEDPMVLGWAGGLLLGHIIIQVVCKIVKSPLQAKPGVAAHQLVCFVPFVYAAYQGVNLWLYDETVAAQHIATYAERLYGANDACFALNRFMLGFQVYDLLATALEPSLRKAEHLGHHTATLLTAMSAAATGGPYFNYYIAFFFGFTELSSVPLAFVDLFRQLPKLANSFPLLNELLRTTFAVSFLVVRVGLFPYVMASKWWPDIYTAYMADDVRCPIYTLAYMTFSSAFLTFLQLFWGYKILRVVLKGNLGGKDMRAAQKETD